jgi:hypothetical protein
VRLEEIDLDTLVRDTDAPLATLSDEQFQALWVGERLQLDPEAESMLVPALKSLVAAGLARLTESGDIELMHDAALIREARTRPATSLVWRGLTEDTPAVETWSLVTRHVLLEQRWEPPGIHHFALRNVRRAVDGLVEALVPMASSSGPWPGAADDLLDRVRAELPRVARIDVLSPPQISEVGDDGPTAASFTLAADDARCVRLTPHPEGTGVLMVSRSDVRRELLQLLTADTVVVAIDLAAEV